MKNFIFTIALTVSIANCAVSQINVPTAANVSITGEHAFIDASLYGLGWGSNESKGLNFPQTDLTQWVFKTDFLNGTDFPTAYDGMVVYNTGTGSTLATAPFGGLEVLQKANNGVVTTVAPGFYYFYNPLVGLNTSTEIVENGKWLPISNSGSGTSTSPVKAYSSLATPTGISIDGKEVFAVTGTFVTLGTNALVTIPKPTGITGYSKMTTFISGKTFRNEISSFNIDPLVLTNNVVTGNGLFSEVYPAGTYSYTLEYFK